MGRNEKTKLFKHQTTAIACKSYSEMLFCSATVVPTKRPPLTKPKTRATRQKHLRECSNKLGRKYLDCSSPCRRVSRNTRTDSKPLVTQSMIKWAFYSICITDANDSPLGNLWSLNKSLTQTCRRPSYRQGMSSPTRLPACFAEARSNSSGLKIHRFISIERYGNIQPTWSICGEWADV
jgi:hypothetical protein